MFYDDLLLCQSLAAKYPIEKPVVECGGIPDPTIAQYDTTIGLMAKLRAQLAPGINLDPTPQQIRDAQLARYVQIHRPLSFLADDYVCEDPATGGLPIERLAEKYNPATNTGIGTAILLSVLEHVADPFEAIDRLRGAMKPGGLVIVSVPFTFPWHPQGGSGEDNFRFTPTGLRHVFTAPAGEPARWEVLESGWRLQIDASQGVLEIHSGKPQAIESCFIAARAI